MQTVLIKWYGPYKLSRCALTTFSNGIYAISRVWGDTETLVYIGRTKRELFKRINEHGYWLSNYRGSIIIRFGRLDASTRVSPKLLADIEALLINAHDTIENTANRIKYSGRNLTVINIGRRGLLIKTVTLPSILRL